MADDNGNRGCPDRERVSGSETYEVNGFAEKRGIAPEQVREIARHGNDRGPRRGSDATDGWVLSEAPPLLGRQSALARALGFRESERLNRKLMDETSLPQLREKYRVAAEGYRRLAEADERLAAAPARIRHP